MTGWPHADPWRDASYSSKLLHEQLKQMEKTIMATLQEVRDEIASTKQEVADTRGVAKSAVVLIDKLLGLISSAAASATDLDTLKADIANIHSETTAEKEELGQAVARGPTT